MYLDIFVVVVALYALWKGWSHGFLKELVSLLGFFAGLLVAALCYRYLGTHLTVTGTRFNMITSIVAFLLLWIVLPMTLGVVATVISKAVNHILVIGKINRFGGAVVSVVKYAILLSCVFNVMNSLHIANPARIKDSRLYEPVSQITLTAVHGFSSDSLSTAPQPTEDDTVWIDVKH